MRRSRSTVFTVLGASTALVAVVILAISPLGARGAGGDYASAARTKPALASVVAGPCAAPTDTVTRTSATPSVSPTPDSVEVGQRADGAIVGTSAADLAEFVAAFNTLRAEACLDTVPIENFRIDGCLEARLFWAAEDPSTDPGSGWGGRGAVRSDRAPEVGCTGSLAGGYGDTATTVAEKWWASPAHRLTLFRPGVTNDAATACIDFAMVHGGIPNETHDFVRASARSRDC